jgi:signal transduction histidine kinase
LASSQPASTPVQPTSVVAPSPSGLAHDARNLIGAVSLYCDLLSSPGVLKPEHIHYARELRLLGARSGALMQRLMLSCVGPYSLESGPASAPEPDSDLPPEDPAFSVTGDPNHASEPPQGGNRPVSLRMIVERCSGLLSRVAGGRTIEVSYGAASSMPVLVTEEAVERILVNLVRNAASALDQAGENASEPPDQAPDQAPSPVPTGSSATIPLDSHACAAGIAAAKRGLRGTVQERIADGTADDTPGAVRIGVGVLLSGAPAGPWPFQRVRLTVEDSGCGMPPELVERVLRGPRLVARGGRGIGLRVVQELVAESGGELRLMSAPMLGTRVQIEWPVAAMSITGAVRPESGILSLRPENLPRGGRPGLAPRPALDAPALQPAQPEKSANAANEREVGNQGGTSC